MTTERNEPKKTQSLRGGELVKLRAKDGATLCGELLLPPASVKPRAAVALSHAMMVDRRTLDTPSGKGLLSQLVSAGACVLWLDQRGHGQSRPTVTEGASWNYDMLVSDIGIVAGYLAERFPELPRVAVGHSLFGQASLAYQATAGLKDPRFSALALVAVNVWMKDLDADPLRLFLKHACFTFSLAISRYFGYLPARRFGTGTADEAYDYYAQMVSWLRKNEWQSRDGTSFLRALPRVNVPVLSIVGAGDWLMSVPASQLRFLQRLSGPVTHITVGKRFGYASDPGHMGVVLDEKLIPLWREIAAWVCDIPPPAR